MYIRANDDIIAREKDIINEIRGYKAESAIIKTCLLVEGTAVTNILAAEKELKLSYINNILTQCNSVICVRVSPKEKAFMVQLVKEN